MARLEVKPQIYDVVFIVFADYSGQLWRLRVDDAWEKTGMGNTTLNESFNPGQHEAVLFLGNSKVSTVPFTVQKYEYVEPEPTPPPPAKIEPAPIQQQPTPALQSNEIPQDRIGTSCQIILKEAFGQRFFKVRHDRRGDLTSYRSDFSVSRSAANNNPLCFETPPPPPKTPDEVSATLSGLQKILNDGLGKLDDLGQTVQEIVERSIQESQAWRAAIDGIWDKLESWLIDRILGILLKALDREVERGP